MTYFRGLRARILLTLLAVAAPAFALAVFWAANRDLSERRLQSSAARQSVELVRAQLARLLDQAALLRVTAEFAPDRRCTLAGSPPPQPSPFAAVRILQNGRNACPGSDGTATDDWLSSAQATLGKQLDAGAAMALAASGGIGGPLVIAAKLSDGATVALLLSGPETDRLFAPALKTFLSGLALFDSSGLILERHASDGPAHWWPATEIAHPDSELKVVHLDAADGDDFRYLTVPAASDGQVVIVGLPALPFLGTEQWHFWASVVQLTAILMTTVVGAVWAIDQSVVRWIDYLRRIALAHGKGRHSVRARRLASAPTELSELGHSLNQMADDAGRQASLLRSTAVEKSALLLELHHRVKNNFQVITSLLSLHKKALPPDQRQEIRFIEDYVQSMAIAYRVAYDGDDVTGVVLRDLLRNVVEALRDTADVPASRVILDIDQEPIWVGLDKAISLGLYLAAILPPYLDALRIRTGYLTISLRRRNEALDVSACGIEPITDDEPMLRARLLQAYVRQLKATVRTSGDPTERAIVVPLGDQPRPVVPGAFLGKPRSPGA